MKIRHAGYKSFKILPLVYDDSLSYYETLCKLTKRINDLQEYIEELEPEISGIEGDIEDIENEISDIKQELVELNAFVNVLNLNISEVETKATNALQIANETSLALRKFKQVEQYNLINQVTSTGESEIIIDTDGALEEFEISKMYLNINRPDAYGYGYNIMRISVKYKGENSYSTLVDLPNASFSTGKVTSINSEKKYNWITKVAAQTSDYTAVFAPVIEKVLNNNSTKNIVAIKITLTSGNSIPTGTTITLIGNKENAIQ